MILNKGITKTAFIRHPACNPNGHIVKNEIAWNADYDGKLANLSVDINTNGKKKHIDMKLNNNDLSRLLSIPSVNKPLDKRLLIDYSPKLTQDHDNQKIIIIPPVYRQINSDISNKPLIMPLSLKRHIYNKPITLKSKLKSKSKTISKSKSKSKSINNKSLKYRLLKHKSNIHNKKTSNTKSI